MKTLIHVIEDHLMEEFDIGHSRAREVALGLHNVVTASGFHFIAGPPEGWHIVMKRDEVE